MNIAWWLHRAGARYADAPAIGLGDEVLRTFGDFASRAAGLGSSLSAQGLAAGDRVAVIARNDASYLEALFGIWWAGLVAVPINAKLHPAEVAWICDDAGVTAAFVTHDVAGHTASVTTASFRGTTVLGSAAYETMAGAVGECPVDRSPADLAWLFYTSGTTGRPKGAMLTHRNLSVMSHAHLAHVDPTGPGDVLLHAAPMSHGSGLYALPAVARGALQVVPESGGFDAEETALLLRRWPRTSLFAPPTLINRLCEAGAEVNPQALRTIIWGGAPMLVPDIVRALERFGPCLAQIYGQGETPMTISVLTKGDVADRDHPRWRHRLASAGLPSNAVEVRIDAPRERDPNIGPVGEIVVRGDTVMAGYWGNEKASAEALRGGWLHTGDIASIDDEGYLTLLDRSKDVIISGGSNIYPREVEEVLAVHPDVREVSVIGRPDPNWGEVVVAYVVGAVSPPDLDRLCVERIARFKRPKDYVLVTELPKNNYGKVLKAELRRIDAGQIGGHSG